MISANKSGPYIKHIYKQFSEDKQNVSIKNQLMVSEQQQKKMDMIVIEHIHCQMNHMIIFYV